MVLVRRHSADGGGGCVAAAARPGGAPDEGARAAPRRRAAAGPHAGRARVAGRHLAVGGVTEPAAFGRECASCRVGCSREGGCLMIAALLLLAVGLADVVIGLFGL